jgi:hypothetical protein
VAAQPARIVVSASRPRKTWEFVVDLSLVSTIVSAKTADVQLAVAAKMLKMNADQATSVVKMIDAAQDNLQRMANVAAGVGGNLDISV